MYIDSENIEPSAPKRKRTLDDDEENENVKAKSSRVTLSNIAPRISTPKTSQSTTPKSAPIRPAGRSPPPKSSMSANRRSITKSRELNKRSIARPFSLASALARSKPKPAPKVPDAWCFDIHVDTEQDEMTNMMHHSTTVLDISDDEGKATSSRGKENIPPNELGLEIPLSHQATATAAPARSSVEDRAPLGDLNAADYYPEGCNAFSHTIVDEEVAEFKKTSSPLAQSQEALTTSIASALDAIVPKETEHTAEKSP